MKRPLCILTFFLGLAIGHLMNLKSNDGIAYDKLRKSIEALKT